MHNAEIIAVLTRAFNEAAAQPILGHYKAAMYKIADAKGCYSVSGVKENDAPDFLKEFRKLKGVKAAYIEPAADYF
jgi:hypothetical protein